MPKAKRAPTRREVVELKVEQVMRQQERVILNRGPIPFAKIIAVVCDSPTPTRASGMHPTVIMSDTRHPDVVFARRVIVELCRRLTYLSYPEIARAMGRPSHSTVITARQRLHRQMAADPSVGVWIDGLIKKLGERK